MLDPSGTTSTGFFGFAATTVLNSPGITSHGASPVFTDGEYSTTCSVAIWLSYTDDDLSSHALLQIRGDGCVGRSCV
jgi:hypothetical protein